jgi:Pentapeptide repeats (8 copies)
MGAHLEGAYLAGVRLERVTLMGACLERTNLMGAHLEGAYLRTTIGLTQEQLNMASGDERTVPPEGLTWPMQWLAPTSEAQQTSRATRGSTISSNCVTGPIPFGG